MNVKQQHQWIFNEQLSCHNFIYMQRQQQQHSARFKIYMCYMFYCYEAHKPTQVRCTCAHTNISFFISDFVVCSVLPWFRLPMPDRLIRFDFDFVILWFYYHYSYRLPFISHQLNNKNTKVCAKQSKANQNKTLSPPNDVNGKSNDESINQLSKQS